MFFQNGVQRNRKYLKEGKRHKVRSIKVPNGENKGDR